METITKPSSISAHSPSKTQAFAGAKNSIEKAHFLGTKLVRLVRSDGSFDDARQLIENGADLEARDSLNLTPLMYAAVRGRIDLCKLLLKNGANIDGYYAFGYTAVKFAEVGQQWDTREFLQQYDGNSNN